MKTQTFGVEIELTGITRKDAAQVIADYYGTTSYRKGEVISYQAAFDAQTAERIRQLENELEIAQGTKNRLTIFDRIEIHDRAQKETAKAILDEVSKHYGGAWLVELYKKYSVEAAE